MQTALETKLTVQEVTIVKMWLSGICVYCQITGSKWHLSRLFWVSLTNTVTLEFMI